MSTIGRDPDFYGMAVNACRSVYLLALLAFAFLLLRQHWTILTMPIPLDLYEGTMPLVTGIIAEGHNPYTLPFQPHATDVYPPLYNILVAPLTGMFPNNLILHRAVSAALILATCFLFGIIPWLQGQDRLHAMAAAVATYAGLVFYSTPVASTNALGTLLFALSVCVPWLLRFSALSLCATVVLGVLAFYAKQYFILGVAIVCLYLFFRVSVFRALALGAGFATALLASLVIVDRSSPYFLDITFFSSTIAISALSTWNMVPLQLRTFAEINAGYLLITVILLGWRLKHRKGATSAVSMRNWLPRLPLRASEPASVQPTDYFWFALMTALLLVMPTIGRNPGNYMTYVFQLISPFLLVGTFSALGKLPRTALWPLPLILFSLYKAWAFLPRDFSYDPSQWQRMESIVGEAHEVLASQMLLMMLLEDGKTIHQDGHTFYFPLAAGKPAWFKGRAGKPDVEEVWSDYIAGLYRRIGDRDFDLIIISPWEMRGIFGRHPPPSGESDGPSYLKRHYYLAETITLSMTDRQGGGSWDLQVWRPGTAH